MSVFYTSDTHFNQERTFEYSLRKMYFDNCQQATAEMVRRWNSVVGADDVVFHLGDFGDFEVAKQLNGKIVLLYGNYERDLGYAPTSWQKDYFHAVYNQLYLHNSDYLMVHEPENRQAAAEFIYQATKLHYFGAFYLFGHIHEKQKVKHNGLNVGVDVHNFAPVSEETIAFYKNAIQNHYDHNCFENF